MKETAKSIIAIIAVFCIAFTSLPKLAGNIDVQAVSGKVKINTKTVTANVAKKEAKKAKTIYLGAKVRKIKPGAFKSCKKAKTLVVQTKKLKKSSVKGSLKASKIKAIKVNVGSPAENKKYAKKYKAFFTKKNAGKAIKVTVLKTATASSGDAAAGSKAGSTSGSTPSGTTPSGTDPGTGGQTTPTDPGTGAETKTVTDYLGVTRTVTKVVINGTTWWETDTSVTKDIAKWDKTVDGEFTIDGGTVMKQVGGVTFNKTLLENPRFLTDMAREPYVEMYNGDFDKLTFTVHDLATVNTHDRNKNPIQKQFVMKNGKRLARFLCLKTETNQNKQIKRILFVKTDNEECDGCGFVSGNITIDVAYNGTKLVTWKLSINPNANSEGLSPHRQLCMQFANEALESLGRSGDYTTDMNRICLYMKNFNYNYKYSSGSEAIWLTCVGGREILETYSIYSEGIYGFDSYGSNPSDPDHAAFHLDSDPSKYYESNGTI